MNEKYIFISGIGMGIVLSVILVIIELESTNLEFKSFVWFNFILGSILYMIFGYYGIRNKNKIFYLKTDKITRKVFLQALNESLSKQDELDQNPDYIVLKEWILELNQED